MLLILFPCSFRYVYDPYKQSLICQFVFSCSIGAKPRHLMLIEHLDGRRVFEVVSSFIPVENRCRYRFFLGTITQFYCYMHCLQTLKLAIGTYTEHKSSWEGLMKRGMGRDYSWENAAIQYEQVFTWAFMDPPYVR